jgi:hypothetical protein
LNRKAFFAPIRNKKWGFFSRIIHSSLTLIALAYCLGFFAISWDEKVRLFLFSEARKFRRAIYLGTI